MTTDWYSTAFDPLTLPERLQRAYNYWLSRADNSGLPTPSRFNPLDLPHELLTYLAVLELAQDGSSGDGRFRLVGGRVVELFGTQVGGQSLGKMLSSSGRSLIEDLSEQLSDERRPIYVKVTNARSLSTKATIDMLVLPLALTPDHANLAIMVFHFESVESVSD